MFCSITIKLKENGSKLVQQKKQILSQWGCTIGQIKLGTHFQLLEKYSHEMSFFMSYTLMNISKNIDLSDKKKIVELTGNGVTQYNGSTFIP